MSFASSAMAKSFTSVPQNDRVVTSFQAYAAGYLEGHVTSDILYMYWQNTVDGYCQGKQKLCDRIVKFVNKNTAWAKAKARSHRQQPYWHQLGLLYDQLEGLEAGYDAAASSNRIPHGDLFWMNVFGDLEDLEQVFDIIKDKK